MNKTFEVRFYLKKEFAKAVRSGQDLPELKPLKNILSRHGLGIHNQLDEFEGFLLKLPLKGEWLKSYPNADERKFLQEMQAITEKTVNDPVKREYLAREFTIEPPAAHGAYKGNEADQVIKDLQSLSKGPLFDKGPRDTEQGVRKVYKPKRHPGTTGKNPDILGRL